MIDQSIIHVCDYKNYLPFTFSEAGIFAALSFLADSTEEGLFTRPLVSQTEILVIQVHHHSLQHTLIGKLVWNIPCKRLERTKNKMNKFATRLTSVFMIFSIVFKTEVASSMLKV